MVTIFWGTTKLGLNHSDYVSVLTILGLITGINLFCVIVVFQVLSSLSHVLHGVSTVQFRHNTLLEERIALETGVEVTLPCGSAPPLPPPSYDEVARNDLKLPLEVRTSQEIKRTFGHIYTCRTVLPSMKQLWQCRC